MILWDVREGLPTETFEGHASGAGLPGLQVFSPDGRTLYTAGDDSRVIIWDVAGERRLGVPFRTGFVHETGKTFPPPFAISPDGRTLAVARFDGRVDLIDAETLRRTGGFEAFDRRSAAAIEYTPDGRTLAVAGGGGGVGVWEAGSGRRLGPLLRFPRGPVSARNPHNVQALAYGPDGLLAAAEVGGTVRIWDVGEGELAHPPLRLPRYVLGLAFSPDGSRLAVPFGYSPSESDGVEVLDVGSGERLARLRVGEVRTVALLPRREPARRRSSGRHGTSLGDRRLAAGRGAARSPRGGRFAAPPDARGRLLRGRPNASDLVRRRHGRLWDVASQQPIGSPLPAPTESARLLTQAARTYTTARFTPDGGRVFVLRDDGRAFRWEVDPAAWRAHACGVAGGGLTPEQWEEVVPEQDYISVCPSDG